MATAREVKEKLPHLSDATVHTALFQFTRSGLVTRTLPGHNILRDSTASREN